MLEGKKYCGLHFALSVFQGSGSFSWRWRMQVGLNWWLETTTSVECQACCKVEAPLPQGHMSF